MQINSNDQISTVPNLQVIEQASDEGHSPLLKERKFMALRDNQKSNSNFSNNNNHN